MPIHDYKNPRRASKRPARFRKPGRWILFAFLIYYLGTLWTAEESPEAPTEEIALAQTDTAEVVESDTLQAESERILEPGWTVISGQIGHGESFSETLIDRGVSKTQIFDELKPAIDHIPGRELDLNLVQQGDQYTVELDSLGVIQQFEYVKHGDLERRFLASRLNGTLQARKEEIPLQKEVVVVSGQIDNSMWQALQQSGENPFLVSYKFSSIFEYYIDFAGDCRTGDQFVCAIEKLYDKTGQFVRYGDILTAEYEGEKGSYQAFLFQVPGQKKGYYDATGKSLRGQFLVNPLQNPRTSSRFTNRRFHPILKKYIPHHGIDYAAPRGKPVWATAAGTVSFIGRKSALGNYVEITHKNGYKTGYGHLSRFPRGLRKGSRVSQKQTIGYVGATGRATGPHLHYNFYQRQHGKHRLVNPERVLKKINKPSGKSIPQAYAAHYRQHSQMLMGLLHREHGTIITAALHDLAQPSEAPSEE
ncbi:MAG: M23 family metallopeptidase [bacterium]|nr:M23 family metallopeptidase [bacterium]